MQHGTANHRNQPYKEWKVAVCPLGKVANDKYDNAHADQRKADIWIKFPHNQSNVNTKLQKRFG